MWPLEGENDRLPCGDTLDIDLNKQALVDSGVITSLDFAFTQFSVQGVRLTTRDESIDAVSIEGTYKLCPNDCSGHGSCSLGGVCTCTDNYGGVDCSIQQHCKSKLSSEAAHVVPLAAAT